MGDILFHQVEFLGHQVVEFLLAWHSCTTLNAFLLNWNHPQIPENLWEKKRSIWHPGFSTAAFKQVAKSQGGIGGDYTGGAGTRHQPSDISAVKPEFSPIITSWHPLSVMKCIPLEFWDPIHAWRSSVYFTNSLHREPRSRPSGQSLSLPNGSNPSKRHWWVWRGRTVTISWTPWWKCWHRIFLTP